jgi:bifunctional DNase/RNase
MDAVPMTVTGVRVELPNNAPVVLLRETEGLLTVPIWVGATEAVAISSAMEGVSPPRPLTHDLLVSVIETLGARLVRIVVTHITDNVFFADLVLGTPQGELVVSSRPSDAIALAVRTGAPVFASRDVVDEVGVVLAEDVEDEAIAQFREMLEDVTVEDFLNEDPGTS